MNDNPAGSRGRGRRGAGFGAGGCGPGGEGAGGGRYRRSVLEAALLSSIAQSTSHGYELVEQIERLAAELVCIDAGSMYRFLRGMEEQGLVSSTWQTPETGPSRRVYQITDEGIEALELMAEALSQRAAATLRLAQHATQAVAQARAAKT
jgi:PadR family transcriptional regulator, regulatory protein PadR